MTYYMIDAARHDSKGRLTHVSIGEVDNVKNRYVYQAEVQPEEFVISKLHRDDKVMLLTPQRSQGATVKLAYDGPREYITEVDPENHPGGTLKDLPPC